MVGINGQNLNNLIFVDDIVLIAPDLQQLKLMLTVGIKEELVENDV